MGRSKTTSRRRTKLPGLPKRLRLASSRIDITRAEFNAVLAVLEERGAFIECLRHDLDVQFTRIAQLQAELDQIRRAWERTK